MRLQFAGRSQPGVGAALELQFVDLETELPVPAAPAILEHVADEPQYQHSIYQSLIQVETGIHPSVEEVGLELYRLVNRLRLLCESHGIGLLACGSHPIASWRDLHLSESPRAQAFVRRLQWVGRRAAVYGLRIHVGVPDGEKAIAIGNALTSIVPLFVAMSASSPFWRGHDTGLASCRTRVVENIPNAGLPPVMLDFGEFQAYVKTLRAAETIERLSDIWWDVRPNLRKGTLEIQACDMPHTVREAMALLAFAQAVVVWLLKNYVEGEIIPQQDLWIVRENKWRATRFGLAAELVINQDGRLATVRDYFEQVCGNLGPLVGRLGLTPQFEDLEWIFKGGPGYVRQRRAFEQMGLEQVPALLVEEFRQDCIRGAAL